MRNLGLAGVVLGIAVMLVGSWINRRNRKRDPLNGRGEIIGAIGFCAFAAGIALLLLRLVYVLWGLL